MAGEHILVIDDSPTILKVVELVLTKAGYRVSTAADGEEGLEAAKSKQPELILLDFVMPKMNGYQVCRALAEDDELQDVPVVLMSAKGDQVGERFVKVMGIVDYITKPFSPEAITAVVGHTLNKFAEDGEGEGEAEEGSGPVSVGSRARARAAANSLAALEAVGVEALDQLAGKIADAVASGIMARLPMDAGIKREDLQANARQGLSGERLRSMLAEFPKAIESATAEALLTGDLAVVPLADVLGLIQNQQQSGLLQVDRGSRQVALYLRKGCLDLGLGSRLSNEFSLERFLQEAKAPEEALGAIDEPELIDQVKQALSLANQKKLPRSVLKAALSRQSAELVYEALRWNVGRFQLLPDGPDAPLADQALLNVTLDGLLMEGFRRVDEWHLIEREVDTFDQVYLRNDDAIARLGRGQLNREELAVLELVDGKNTVKDIIRQSRMSSFDVSKMLYRLLSIKLIRKRVAPVAV